MAVWIWRIQILLWIVTLSDLNVEGSTYVSLGCWRDEVDRAIGGSRSVSSVQECFVIAENLGNRVFAVQAGGECRTTSTAENTYNKYGPSNGCPDHGRGGGWANHVYFIENVNYIIRKSGVECNSGDNHLGDFSSIGECADKCHQTPGCNFFVYGHGSREKKCYREQTETADCSEGWQDNEYNFYEIITGFMVTKMQKISVETSGIHSIDTIIVPSILICVDKCKSTREASETPTVQHCNMISYNKVSSTCELARMEGMAGAASATTKDVFVSVPNNVASPGPPPGPNPSGPPPGPNPSSPPPGPPAG